MDEKKSTGTISSEQIKEKIVRTPKTAGCAFLRLVISLWVLLRKPDLPAWAKAIVMSALLYYINPFDVVCDFVPIAGYVDDLAVMTLALSQLYAFMDDSVRIAVDKRLPKHCRGVVFNMDGLQKEVK